MKITKVYEILVLLGLNRVFFLEGRQRQYCLENQIFLFLDVLTISGGLKSKLEFVFGTVIMQFFTFSKNLYSPNLEKLTLSKYNPPLQNQNFQILSPNFFQNFVPTHREEMWEGWVHVIY